MGYTKLFDSLWTGSLYGKFEASAVFMVFLSLADQHGQVDMTPEAIAGRTGWPLDFIRAGINELEAPDIRSRTPDADGRRIIRLNEHRDWGWLITNHEKYREQERSAERREYLRQAKKKERQALREKKSTTVNKSQHVNLSEQNRAEQNRREESENARAESSEAVVPAAIPDDALGRLRPEVLTCVLLRRAGLGAKCANPMHPGLLATVKAGVAPEAIVAIAQEFPDKPMAYWLSTAMGRAKDAAGVTPLPYIATEAQNAWATLIASDGGFRTDRVAAALQAVGGWLAIKARTTFNEGKLRADFCRAYAEFKADRGPINEEKKGASSASANSPAR